MNGYLLSSMLANVQHHPYLLADLVLDAKALKAQATLMNRLNALPEYSFVLQYISENINQPVQVMGQWNSYGLGSLQYPEKSITTHNLGKATLDGGVYVLNAWDDYSQYVGSTYNHYSRLTSHMMKFKRDWGPSPDLTDKYQWASINGGLRAWNWFEVYRTFNYYINFVQAFPLHPLTYGEYLILVSLSKFLPRLLEQSLFNVWCFDWNKTSNVNFDLQRQCPYDLNTTTWGDPANHVQIIDYHTRQVLRTPISSLSMAKDALGVRTAYWKRRYNKLPLTVDSSVLGRKVIIQKATSKHP